MNEIEYLGEHLWVGTVGHLSIIMGFVASLFTAFTYYRCTQTRGTELSEGWRTLGRIGWMVHSVCVFSLFGVILYAMSQYYYEYQYVQAHVSDDLPMRYILSAFWEGQEGSFMLWMIWHAVLGMFVWRRDYKWESPVLAVVVLINAVIFSMLLGLYIDFGDTVFKIGANPTLLLRNVLELPLFMNADYTSLITGNGLNPLLQNYWMTIHPPMLFLGFASTAFPFAFAIAGLWTGDHKGWLKPATNWSLFSAGVLGTGILMGAIWAYEALSFGGYWAWDPVENASLVPWMLLVAGVHTHLIARNSGYAIRSTYLFYILTFVFILYSTYLTRSGVLGETSVHAFTEMGLGYQLVFFVLFFLLLGIVLYIYRYKSIPAPEREENIKSREFWMFIGSLVLMFGGFLIISSTSLPVFNKIATYFNEDYIGRVIEDPIEHFNKFQLWIAVFISILSSVAIYLRYGSKQRKWSRITKHILIAAVIAAVLTYLLTFWISYKGAWQYTLLTFFGLFAMVANVDYIFTQTKNDIRLSSSAVAHFGFGAMMLGIITSGLNQSFISNNPFVFGESMDDVSRKRSIVLIKGEPLYSEGHFITWQSDTLIANMRHYDINFKKIDEERNVLEEWNLRPNAVYANDFSKISAFNPDTRHKWHEDIFTCILNLSPPMMSQEQLKEMEDTLVYNTYYASVGDTIRGVENDIVIERLSYEPSHPEYNPEDNDFGVSLVTSFYNRESKKDSTVETSLGLRGPLVYKYPEKIESFGVRVRPADTLMNMIFPAETDLVYMPYKTTQGSSFTVDGTTIELVELNNKPAKSSYKPEDGDIAIEARLKVTRDGISYPATPTYVIRGNIPMSIKHYIPQTGTHIRFSNIDPINETFGFKVAQQSTELPPLAIEVAEKVTRSDLLLLEAKIFPGINIFWSGTIMMMMGFLMAWLLRVFYKSDRDRKQKKES